MATSVTSTLDRLGEALLDLGHESAHLSASREPSGHVWFTISGRNVDGRFFSGTARTPTAAIAAADRDLAIRASGGLYIDA